MNAAAILYTISLPTIGLVAGLVMGYYWRHHQQQKINDALSKSAIVSAQVQSFVSRVGGDTEDAIVKFADLLQHLNSSIQATVAVVEDIQEKMAITAERGGPMGHNAQDLKIIQNRYQEMLSEIMMQLNLTVERKNEDIAKLDHIRDGVNRMRPFSQEISRIALGTKVIALNATIEAARAGKHGECFGVVADEVRRLADKANASAASVENELAGVIGDIEAAIDDVKIAMDVETRFINSTVTLLQDVVLSVVDSFVSLSDVIQRSLGDSSRFRDDVNSIVVNLQFEDICHQMSQHTVKLLGSIQDDLRQVNARQLSNDNGKDPHSHNQTVFARVSQLFTMAREVQNARAALNLDAPSGSQSHPDSVDDDVFFFDDPSDLPSEIAPPAQVSDAVAADPNADDVLFFDDPSGLPSEIAPPVQVSGAVAADPNADDVTFFDEADPSHSGIEDQEITLKQTAVCANSPAPVPANGKPAVFVKHNGDVSGVMMRGIARPSARKKESVAPQASKPVTFDNDEDVTFF